MDWRGPGRVGTASLGCSPAAILAHTVVRAVVFDLFDTLVDLDWDALPEIEVLGQRSRSTSRALHEVLRAHSAVDFDTFVRTLREIDVEFREARAEAGLELPTTERFTLLLERLGIAGSDLAQELTRVHMDAIRSIVRPLPHHRQVLERLRRRVLLAVCSNFSHAPTARRILRESQLLPLFDAVVISEEVGVRKPRSEIFEATLERLRTRPDETVHVGDRLAADVEGATRAGLTAVWLVRRVDDPEGQLRSHEGSRPEHIIRDLAEVESVLDHTLGAAP